MMKRIQQSHRFSQATVSSNTMYITGQVALDNPNGSIMDQAKEVLSRIDNLLNEENIDKTSILFANIWLRDIKDYDEMNQVWDQWVDKDYTPARACVQAILVSSFRVEISAIAELQPTS